MSRSLLEHRAADTSRQGAIGRARTVLLGEDGKFRPGESPLARDTRIRARLATAFAAITEEELRACPTAGEWRPPNWCPIYEHPLGDFCWHPTKGLMSPISYAASVAHTCPCCGRVYHFE